jgi:simple sugar transport system ATP-binding protein
MTDHGSAATVPQQVDGANGQPLAEAISVSKRFGSTRALEDVSLAVRAQELHGLVGRNGAGKSTLVKILTGLFRPDTGAVRFGGEQAPPPTARDAWLERVACVYQHPTVVPALTVAENLFLNAVPGGKIVNWNLLYRRAAEELESWDIKLRPDQETADLDVEERQLVEIVRALRRGSRFIILDEPTAQLDAHAIERLFTRIRQLQEQGVSFLFISHHLEEIYDLCETVTVLRDGKHILTRPVGEIPQDELIAAMVGEEVVGQASTSERQQVAERASDEVVLKVEDLTIDRLCDGISFSVKAGECVGLAGQASSGKAAVGDAIVGLVQPDSGELFVGDEPLEGATVSDRIAKGVGYVPEDRHRRGLIPFMSVEENATMSVLPRLVRGFGLIRRGDRRNRARELIDSLTIKVSSPDQLIVELSGGNQQKTVMGRALASNPRLLVLIRPTAGVDIASKEALYRVVRRACAEGTGVLLISDEVDELAICDPILVMFRGRITHRFTGDFADHQLVAAMEGVEDGNG